MAPGTGNSADHLIWMYPDVSHLTHMIRIMIHMTLPSTKGFIQGKHTKTLVFDVFSARKMIYTGGCLLHRSVSLEEAFQQNIMWVIHSTVTGNLPRYGERIDLL